MTGYEDGWPFTVKLSRGNNIRRRNARQSCSDVGWKLIDPLLVGIESVAPLRDERAIVLAPFNQKMRHRQCQCRVRPGSWAQPYVRQIACRPFDRIDHDYSPSALLERLRARHCVGSAAYGLRPTSIAHLVLSISSPFFMGTPVSFSLNA